MRAAVVCFTVDEVEVDAEAQHEQTAEKVKSQDCTFCLNSSAFDNKLRI